MVGQPFRAASGLSSPDCAAPKSGLESPDAGWKARPTVTAFIAGRLTMEMCRPRSARSSLPVDAKTEITRDGHPAQSADLKKGARVVVDIPEGSKDKVASSVRIGVAAATKTAHK